MLGVRGSRAKGGRQAGPALVARRQRVPLDMERVLLGHETLLKGASQPQRHCEVGRRSHGVQLPRVADDIHGNDMLQRGHHRDLHH